MFGSGIRRCDGIGRRAGLKIRSQRWGAGSTPATGTNRVPRYAGVYQGLLFIQLYSRAKAPSFLCLTNAARKIEYGGIAQLGERLNGIQEVSGSIPLISTSRQCRLPNIGKVRRNSYVRTPMILFLLKSRLSPPAGSAGCQTSGKCVVKPSQNLRRRVRQMRICRRFFHRLSNGVLICD